MPFDSFYESRNSNSLNQVESDLSVLQDFCSSHRNFKGVRTPPRDMEYGPAVKETYKDMCSTKQGDVSDLNIRRDRVDRVGQEYKAAGHRRWGWFGS